MATKAKPVKAKAAPAPRKKASNWPRNVGVSLVVVAFVVMAGAIVHLANRSGGGPSRKPVVAQAFADYEVSIRTMWLEAADKANRGEFKSQAEAKKWLSDQWQQKTIDAWLPVDQIEKDVVKGDKWADAGAELWTRFAGEK